MPLQIIKRNLCKMGKIIKFTKAALPLTPSMIKTLRAACRKQSNNKSFGQKDLNGSFLVLVERELISAKTIMGTNEKQVSWYVTDAGVKTLSNLGFNDPC